MAQAGVLNLLTRGARRFRIEDHEVERDGLLVARVRWLEELPAEAVPEAQADLLPLLKTIVAELGERLPPPHLFDDAAWVGARYTELLPIPLLAKQKLLELDDPLSRLEILQKYLREHGLQGPSPLVRSHGMQRQRSPTRTRRCLGHRAETDRH